MALDATLSGATADTMATLAEVRDYSVKHYLPSDPVRSTFEGLATAEQEVVVRAAARDIATIRFSGVPATTTQAMPFPLFGQTAIPLSIVQAQSEQALYRASGGGRNLRAEAQSQGVSSLKMGAETEEEYTGYSGIEIAPLAIDLLSEWTLNSGRIV